MDGYSFKLWAKGRGQFWKVEEMDGCYPQTFGRCSYGWILSSDLWEGVDMEGYYPQNFGKG